MLRLNPDHPLLWCDPHTVQFGVDAIATVEITSPWMERLIHSLRSGVRRRSFDVVAHSFGAPRDEARSLLATLEPVLAAAPLVLPKVWIDPGEDLPLLVALRLAEALGDEGFPVHEGSAPPPADADQEFPEGIVIVVSAGVATAKRSSTHLRDDRPHLPVAFDGNGVTVGPLVVPGETPCLSCRDEHDRDQNPFWAVLHTQLMAHRPAAVSLRRVADAAESVRALLAERAETGSGRSIRVSGDERHHESRSVHFHEECRCQFLQENAPAPVPLGPRIATRSLPEFAQLA